jgi:ABC-type nitrate/sulfonate/bicarbonate transport system substrate-binding protein
VAKNVKQFSDLKGKTVAVFDVKAGDAAYMRLAFEGAGLGPADYKVEKIGPARERLEAVWTGRVTATLLTGPLAFEARKRGLNVEPISQYVRAVADELIVGRRDILEGERKGVVGTLRALKAAVTWLYAGTNREAVIGLIEKEYKLPNDVARFLYDELIAKARIYSQTLTMSAELTKETGEWLARRDLKLRQDVFDESYLKLTQ